MPALPADIIRSTRRSRVIQRVDPEIQAAFPTARDLLNDPQPGYFEFAADAAKVLDKAATLIGVFRRRFQVTIAEEMPIDPMIEIPTYHLLDPEHDADCNIVVVRIEIDDETETTTIEGLG